MFFWRNKKLLSSTNLVIIQALAACWIVIDTYPNNDTAWHLYVAQLLLEGKKLYHDIIEINPPLVYHLQLIPAYLAQISGVEALLLSKIMFLLFAGLSLWLIRSIVAPHPNFHLLWISSAFCLLWLPLCLFINQFGQKEHLFMMAILPYSLQRLFLFPDEPKKPLATLSLIIAAIGLCIKPHFLLWFCFLEWSCWKRRTERPSIFTLFYSKPFLIVGITYLIYLLWIAIFMPAYFSNVMAVLAPFYYYYRTPADIYLIIQSITYLCLPIIPMVMLYRYANQSVLYWYGLFFIAWGIGLLQLKGWQYHYYPAMVCQIIIGAMICQHYHQRHSLWKRKSDYIAFFFGALTGFLTFPIFHNSVFMTSSTNFYLMLIAMVIITILFLDIKNKQEQQEKENDTTNTIRFPRGWAHVFSAAFFIGSIAYTSLNGLVMTASENNTERVYHIKGMREYLQSQDTSEPIVILSEKLVDAFPLMHYIPNQWGIEASNLWLLTGIENYRHKFPQYSKNNALVEKANQQLVQRITTSIMEQRPSLIFVDVQQDLFLRWNRKIISYIGYFSQNESFKDFFETYYEFKEFLHKPKDKNPKYAVYQRKNSNIPPH